MSVNDKKKSEIETKEGKVQSISSAAQVPIEHLEQFCSKQPLTLRKYTGPSLSFMSLCEEGSVAENRNGSTLKLNELKSEKEIECCTFVEREEFERMIVAASTLRDKTILRLLMATGIKIAELYNLNIENIDASNMIIYISATRYERRIDLDSQTSELLRSYIEIARGTPNSEVERALFLSRSRKRLSIRTIQEIIKKCRKTAGIKKKITAHTFRRTVCHILKERGVQCKTIMAFLGYDCPPKMLNGAVQSLKPLEEEI